jgi:hypothetical protein
MLDLVVVGYLQPMGAEHLTGSRATACCLSRAGSRGSRESSIWPVIAVSELDGGIEQRPGVVTSRMDSRRRLPVVAIVLVDVHLRAGFDRCRGVTPSEADDSCEDGFDR